MTEFDVNAFGAGDQNLARRIVTADEGATAGLTKEEAAGILRGDPKFANKLDQVLEERNRRLAPAGSLNLPELLDARRLEYSIPNEVFEMQACFDKVIVFQIPEDKSDTYGDTSIIQPDVVKARRDNESPIGIICSAGLQAHNELLTNGIDIGHKVAIVRLAPWRKEAGSTGGHFHEMMIIKSGDIIGSQDLADALRSGEVRAVWNAEMQSHQYVDKNGDAWDPKLPQMSAEV